jgi:hypothetical protein
MSQPAFNAATAPWVWLPATLAPSMLRSSLKMAPVKPI